MDKSVAIKVEGLGKKFCINQRKSMIYGGLDVFRSMVGFPKRRDFLRDHEIWALQDINFEVKKGETLGIIGINGAGKSTLLRVLSGIYPPDAGRVSVRGSIGALIAAGAGFHPDMTGRENIYMNGAIVGLKKQEIDSKLEEIVEFAEIGQFIDSPVRFYSSGMYVRLGFAIAANIKPGILLIDEILSVGDLSFQNKAFRKLKELRESVDAVLFVSHNMDHIRNISTDLIFLDSGRVAFRGDVEEGIIRYQAHTDDLGKKSSDAEIKRKWSKVGLRFDSSMVELKGISVGNQDGEFNGEIRTGDDIVLKVDFSANRVIDRPLFSIGVLDDRNTQVIVQRDHDNRIHFDKIEPGDYRLKVVFRRPPLVSGLYKISFAMRDTDSCEILTKHTKFNTFIVRGEKFSRGIVDCESNWDLRPIGFPLPEAE